jgi:pimeloyl-ACP methyl ester carboxylesterase
MLIFKHKIHFITPNQPQLDKPLFVFLPGMDGTGLLLRHQMAKFNLGETFDIRCLAIPADDLSSWSQLTQSVIRLLGQEIGLNRRPVYLCGESFGGCLGMQVALQAPDLVDRIILVNPASCFNQQAWLKWGSYLPGWLPTPIYHVGVMGLLPLLGSLSRMPAKESENLLAAMQSVSHPSSTWRLNLLREFEINHQQLAQIRQPVLVIASTDDWLLPSVRESQRLTTFLPNAQRVLLKNSGHACLLETDVNLINILQQQDFLPFLSNSPSKVSAA